MNQYPPYGPGSQNNGSGYGYPPRQNNHKPGGSSNTKTIIIVASICVFLGALIAFGCFFLFSGDGSRTVAQIGDSMFPGDTKNSDERFHSFDWLSENKVGATDLSGLSAGDLRLLRNAIFAMHGYIFKDKDLTEYFEQFEWYTPKKSNVTKELSSIEQSNVRFIKKYEGKAGKDGSSKSARSASDGDDYYDLVGNTYLSDSDVNWRSKSELRLMRNTIYARHGRKFKSKDLQDYFNGMSWYTPKVTEISPGSLSSIEKHNLKLIQKYE